MVTIIKKANHFFKYYLNIPAAKKLIPKNDKTILFNIKDNDSFLVVFKNNKIKVLKKEFDKNNMDKLFDLVVDSDSKTIHEIFDLSLTPAEAYQNKRLYFHGIPYKEYPWLTHFIRVLQTKRDRG